MEAQKLRTMTHDNSTPAIAVISIATSLIMQLGIGNILLTVCATITTTLLSLIIKVIWDVFFKDKMQEWMSKFKRKKD